MCLRQVRRQDIFHRTEALLSEPARAAFDGVDGLQPLLKVPRTISHNVVGARHGEQGACQGQEAHNLHDGRGTGAGGAARVGALPRVGVGRVEPHGATAKRWTRTTRPRAPKQVDVWNSGWLVDLSARIPNWTCA